MAMQDSGALASRSVIPVDQSLRTAMQPIEYHEFHSMLRTNRLKNNNRTPTYTFQEVCHVVQLLSMRVLVISVDREQTVDNACPDPIVTITYLASKDMWVNASDGPSPSNIDYE
jgi:hypothetical protein